MRRRCAAWASVLFVLATAACAGSPPESAPTTVLVVRHAEKATGDDPELTEAGRQRALDLARATADAGLRAVYSTPFRRNRETAAPAAERAGVEVTTHEIDGQDLPGWSRGFAAMLLERHAGQHVLVVGHSNTVPLVVEALGIADAPRLEDTDYDDLFVVTVRAAGPAELLHLHYGAASP